MISTEKLADVLTNYIVKNKAIEEEDYQIYKYGFWTGIEMLICIVSCYGIAIQMGMIKECTMLFLVFFSLRSFVGGIHMDSYKKCFACSCMVVFLILFAVKNIHLTNMLALGVINFELLIIFFTNPVENINRPVDEKEKKLFAQRIKQILTIILGLTVFLFIMGYNNYLVTITYTLGIIIISMFLGKAKLAKNCRRVLESENSFD